MKTDFLLFLGSVFQISSNILHKNSLCQDNFYTYSKISSNCDSVQCRMEASQGFPEDENATFCRFVPSLYYIQMFPIPMILCNCTPHGTAQRCILTKSCLLTIQNYQTHNGTNVCCHLSQNTKSNLRFKIGQFWGQFQ